MDGRWYVSACYHGKRDVVQDIQQKLQDQDSRAQLVQRGQSATYYSGCGQLCVHAQPCLSVQLCIQGLGDAACSSAGVLILVLQQSVGGWGGTAAAPLRVCKHMHLSDRSQRHTQDASRLF
jgi:hypothetical protein